MIDHRPGLAVGDRSRHGVSRLLEVEGDKSAKKTFKRYPIGYFHIDIAEVRTEEGKLHLFVAVDRTSKYAFARLTQRATTREARAFLDMLVEAVPYRIHTVLTDNGIQFAELPRNRGGATFATPVHEVLFVRPDGGLTTRVEVGLLAPVTNVQLPKVR